jgi:hypothetical protein
MERTLREWSYTGPLDTHAYRTLKKSNRNDQVASTLGFLQDPFYVTERPLFDDYALPHLEERPRLHEEARCHNGLERSDFPFINRLRNATQPHNVYDAGRCQDWKSI